MFLRKPSEKLLRTSIEVVLCTNCGLVQLTQDFENNYEDDYQRNTTFSKSANNFINHNIDQLKHKLGSFTDKQIIEIGCGDGYFLSKLQKEGAQVVGYEPSSAACALAEQKGVRVNNAFFTGDESESEYDIFVLRYVLEHISDPVDFLKKIKGVLKPNAYGLIEVPNYQKMKDDHRYFEFFREHTCYFSPTSLTRVLELSGFEVLTTYTVMNEEYLVAIVKNQNLSSHLMFEEYSSKINSALHDMVQMCIDDGKQVAFWGASGGGVSLLSYANIDSKKISCIFDSDPNKWDLFTYGTNILIRKPDVASVSSIDAIIILSPTYEKEITNDLLNSLNYEGKIGSIKGIPHWV